MPAAVPVNTKNPVYLSHPKMDRGLRIDTGADAITWSYNLLSNVTPTYGGEVIQILGVNTGPITIQGTSRNPRHMRQIYHWMRDYMTIAGTGDRDETAAIFKYPTRGWVFRVHITDASGFQYGLEQQHTIPWSITCEVLEDGANSLEQATMEQFNGQNLFEAEGTPLESGVGFDPTSALINPNADSNISQGGSAISSTPYEEQFRTAGDNFQTMVAAWTAGDIEQWGFDALNDPTSQFNKTSNDYWTSIFGTDTLVSSSTSGGSNSEGAGSTDTSTRAGVVNAIVQVFEDKGIPGRLGVALAIQESNLNPDARQPDGDHAVGLFQTFPTGAGGSRSYAEELRKAFASSGKVTDNYTAEMQITAASEWVAAAKNGSPQVPANPPFSIDDAGDFKRCAEWAQAAQRAGVDYRDSQRFKDSWRSAKTEIENARGSGAGVVSANGKAAPLPGPLDIRSGVGARWGRQHQGLDMVAPIDSPIFSVTDGRVTKVVSGCVVGDTSCGGGWGNHVMIRDTDGTDWIYAHMKHAPRVKQGDRVKAGDAIGTMGNTGHSYGDHLHIEMHIGGYKNVSDPEPLMKEIYGNQ